MTPTADHAEPLDEPKEEKADPWLGRTVADKFRVETLIGEGAMGRVYRAEQVALGKPVAVKVLHRHLGGDERIARRFHREAKAASRLSHPNSLQIIDFGDAGDGDLYIAMELLEGDDLQAIIDTDAPLSPARIGEIMGQLLRALDEAHHAGIIHRDLKPENVVVLEGRDGEEKVKVCDFGIAKIVEQEGRSTAITKDGYVCGTPEYMAPEQARGDPVDARSDIYSVGTVLYQMLCGRVPFSAENALGVITKHLMEKPPRPRRVQPTWGIPRSLERIALKALAKDPADRYASAKEMSQAIRDAVEELGERAHERLGQGSFYVDAPEPEEEDLDEEELGTSSTQERVVQAPTKTPNHVWLYGLAAALGVLAFGIWLWARPPEPSPPPPAIATDPPDPTPAASPDPAPDPDPDPAPVPDPDPSLAPDPDPEPTATNPEPTTRRARRRRARSSSPPDEERPASAGQAALEEGRRAMLGGDLRGAIAHFERAARAMPRNAQVQKQLGRAYMRVGDVAEGTAAYRRYLELAPSAPDRAIIERIIAQQAD